MAEIRTLVVADDPLARAGLAALLAGQAGCVVVGRVSGAEVAAALDVHRPEVLLWDTGWDPLPIIDQVAALGDDVPPLAILLPDAMHAAEAWSAGAKAVLRRDSAPERIAAALVAAAGGLAAIEPDFLPLLRLPARPTAARAWNGPEEPKLLEELTPREAEVLRLIAEGLPNKIIALQLGISEHTVKFHINAILGKLGATSRTEAVVKATRLGLILL